MTKIIVRLKGGKGSGFHGHRGRPGLVGGSSSSFVPSSVTSEHDWEQMHTDAVERIQEWKDSGMTEEEIIRNGYFWRKIAQEYNQTWDWAVWNEIHNLAESRGYKYKDELTDEDILNDPLMDEELLLSDKYQRAMLSADTVYTNYRNYNDKDKLYRYINSKDGQLAREISLHKLWRSVVENGGKLVTPSSLMAVHALRKKIALFPGMQKLRDAKTFQEALDTDIVVYRGKADFYGNRPTIGKLISYTTSPQIARLFAEGFYASINKPGTGAILKRTVKLRDIFAFINNDGEYEVVLPPQ